MSISSSPIPASSGSNTSGEGTATAPGNRDALVLLLLWLVVTAYNLFKPFHIDDTAYLDIARWISTHPLHPMSGMETWTHGYAEPVYRSILHPPLYMYAMAGWSRLFGWSEPAMHALGALVSLAAIFWLYRLTRALVPRAALWTTGAIVLCPAFIVEQNMMIDIPLFASWLAFFNLLVVDVESPRQTRRYVLAGLALSAALLIKYSSLVLFPILLLSLLLERRFRQAWTFLIPVAVVVLWSLFNLYDFGGVHLLSHTQGGGHGWPRWAFGWMTNLGALTALGAVVLVRSQHRFRQAAAIIYAAAFLAFLLLVVLVARGLVSDRHAELLLAAAYAVNGFLTLCVVAWSVRSLPWPRLLQRNAVSPANLRRLYLLVWIVLTGGFYIVLSPFIAARHLLLVLPPVFLLALLYWGGNLDRASKRFTLALTVSISAGLCLSDWRYANFYREQAASLSRMDHPAGTQLWAAGHWGFQWYAQQDGIRQLDTKRSPMHAGDLLLTPVDTDFEWPEIPVETTLVQADTQPHPLLNLFCTGEGAHLYHAPRAWLLQHNCVDRVEVYRIDKVADPALAGTRYQQPLALRIR